MSQTRTPPAFSPARARAQRAFLGLTLADLSERMEIAGVETSTSTLCRWERGNSVPSRPALAALARALRCRVMDLT